MEAVGLLVTLEAKAGKEDDLASFLADALPLVEGVRCIQAGLSLFRASRRACAAACEVRGYRTPSRTL